MNATDLPSKASCHKGNSVLWTSSAGGRLTVGGEHLGLMVDLTNGQNSPKAIASLVGNKEGKALAKNLMALTAVPSLPYLNLPIRDYGIPTWSTKTFEALAKDVRAVLNAGTDVTIACTGGHGRSGTIAAVLLQLLDPVKDEHPVTRLRRLHCANAVETAEQVRYVCDCTGFLFDKELVIERAPVVTTNSLVPTAYDDRWAKYTPSSYNKPTGAKPEPLVTRRNGSGKTVHLVQCSMCTEWFDPKTGEIRNDKYTYPDFKLDDDYPMCGGCDHWTTQEAAKRGKHPAESEPF